MYTIKTIQNIVGGQFLQLHNENANIEHLLLDSRKLLFPSSSLFFALSGLRKSGRDFVDELYKKGVSNFVVDKSFLCNKNDYVNANILQVNNVLEALQLLAAHHRNQYKLPVVAITGSNGKTIVKEWLYQLLHDRYNIVRSPKSYNSQIGVPLSIWQINAQHTLGIFEAGISKPGEMERLEKIMQPSVGIFTNIGEAHNEGFVSMQQKIKEKLRLFTHCDVLIYNKDSIAPYIDMEHEELFVNNKLRFFSWSKKEGATLVIQKIEHNQDSATIQALYNKKDKIEITIPFVDAASIENAITCCCYLLYANVSYKDIAGKMLHLRAVEMRLELKEGINNCSVINDSYSADINSLIIALDFLCQQQQHSKRTLILSDILQTGKSGEELYKQIASILQQKNINRLIGVGKEISVHQQVFHNILETSFYATTDDFVRHFREIYFNNESILLKGARVFEFEKISHLLELQSHQTVLEINLTAVAHNLQQYQRQLQPGVKVMAMVKAFSYGSGSYEIANLLQFHKVDYLAVAYADEGVELRKAGITLPIMVMNAEQSTFHHLLQYDLEPEIYSLTILDDFKFYLKNIGIQQYPVHIKVDTGMHRLGFVQQEIATLITHLKQDNLLRVQSVFSHLVASDDPGLDAFTQKQAGIFNNCCQLLEDALGYPFLKHIGNTAAIHRHKNLQLDMVRLGIGLYGVDNDSQMQQLLQNVTTLKTTIAQIKTVKAGDTVGYSRKGKVTKDSRIATVRIGYADGYPRSMSNGVGYMLIKGRPAPVVGVVCMDMTMLDISDLAAEEGDEVIVFGKDLPVNQLAHWANTISYEILAGISQRVKRIYYEE